MFAVWYYTCACLSCFALPAFTIVLTGVFADTIVRVHLLVKYSFGSPLLLLSRTWLLLLLLLLHSLAQIGSKVYVPFVPSGCITTIEALLPLLLHIIILTRLGGALRISSTTALSGTVGRHTQKWKRSSRLPLSQPTLVNCGTRCWRR